MMRTSHCAFGSEIEVRRAPSPPRRASDHPVGRLANTREICRAPAGELGPAVNYHGGRRHGNKTGKAPRIGREKRWRTGESWWDRTADCLIEEAMPTCLCPTIQTTRFHNRHIPGTVVVLMLG